MEESQSPGSQSQPCPKIENPQKYQDEETKSSLNSHFLCGKGFKILTENDGST